MNSGLSCDCLSDQYCGGTGFQVAVLPKHRLSFSFRGGDAGRLCLRNITALKDSPQSHSGHGRLEAWSILWKQHDAVYCICCFIDRNIPELIWPNIKFTTHTPTPIKWRKIRPTATLVGRKKRLIWILTGSRALNSFQIENIQVDLRLWL